jgi:hypothetical protein
MRSLTVYDLNESAISSDMSSLELVKSSSTFSTEESDSRSGTETDSSSSGMDENSNRSSSNEREKDSGVDCGEPDFIVPDKELIEKIVNQVEAYFSDENLIKDEFILKHIRRNREGYISLKLVSSFRKVKALSKNWKVVAHCIKVASNKLQINDLCTKVRRITPLPTVDGTKYSRTLIAHNFPNGCDTIDEIGKIFSKYGDISLIRILRPNPEAVIPSNLLAIIGKKFDVNKTTFATIEFNNKSDAEKALKNLELNKNNNWRNSLEVIAMKPSVNKPNKTTIKSCDKSKKTNTTENSNTEMKRSHLKKSYNKQKLNDCPPLVRRQKSKSYSAGDELNSLNKIPENKPILQIQRPVNRFTNTNSSTHTSRLPANIIRYPYGPDGTKGFNTTRQKRSHSEP